jgi:Sec-independent protein translocase protein TatA
MGDVSKYYRALARPDWARTVPGRLVLGAPRLPTVTVDGNTMTRGLRAAAEAVAEAMRGMRRVMRSVGSSFSRAANAEEVVQGYMTVMRVRGGLVEWQGAGIGDLVHTLMVEPSAQALEPGEGPWMDLLTPANRARVAAAALEGYVLHHDGPAPEVLAWHRHWPTGRVSVGRESK